MCDFIALTRCCKVISFLHSISVMMHRNFTSQDACHKQMTKVMSSRLLSSVKKLYSTQQKWSTIEREAFAVIEMLQRVRAWVFGYKIHLYCDHNPLCFLTEAAPKSAKLMRWALALAKYDITLRGREIKYDGSTRLPNENKLYIDSQTSVSLGVTYFLPA